MSIFQKYATAIFSFAVLAIGGFQALVAVLGAGHTTGQLITSVAVFAVLIVGGIATFGVPLLEAKWQGAVKTGIALFTTLVAAVLPFATKGHFDVKTDLPLVVLAVLNAIATEFGIQIRLAVPTPVAVTLPVNFVTNPVTSASSSGK